MLLCLREPLALVAGDAPLTTKAVKALPQGCLGTLLHRADALLGGLLFLNEGRPLFCLRVAEQLKVCALLLLAFKLLLLLLSFLGLGVGEGDAQRACVRAHGHPAKGSGEVVRQPAYRQDAGLAQVEALPCGLREGGHGVPEGLHRPLSAGAQECHAVVCVLRGTDPAPRYTEPHLRDGLQPAVEGPRHEQVHCWGERAALPHPRFPLARLGDPPIDDS